MLINLGYIVMVFDMRGHATYKEIKSKLKTNDQIYVLDSTHPQHNTTLSYGWILKGHENDKFINTNTGRERLNLTGAFRSHFITLTTGALQ